MSDQEFVDAMCTKGVESFHNQAKHLPRLRNYESPSFLTLQQQGVKGEPRKLLLLCSIASTCRVEKKKKGIKIDLGKLDFRRSWILMLDRVKLVTQDCLEGLTPVLILLDRSVPGNSLS